MNRPEQRDDEERTRDEGPIQEIGPAPGDEERASDVTEANLALERAHEGGAGSEPGPDQINDQRDGSEHSVDEKLPVSSESPEDKAQDIINSGILRM